MMLLWCVRDIDSLIISVVHLIMVQCLLSSMQLCGNWFDYSIGECNTLWGKYERVAWSCSQAYPTFILIELKKKKSRRPGNEAMVRGATVLYAFISQCKCHDCVLQLIHLLESVLSTLESKRLFCCSARVNSLSWASLQSGFSHANCSLLWSESHAGWQTTKHNKHYPSFSSPVCYEHFWDFPLHHLVWRKILGPPPV